MASLGVGWAGNGMGLSGDGWLCKNRDFLSPSSHPSLCCISRDMCTANVSALMG